MNKTTTLAALVAAFAIAAPAAQAQISLEARGSIQNPTGDFGDDATSEAGFAGAVFFNVSPRLSLYGGYGVETFGCEGCNDDDGYQSKGFEGGAKFILTPTPTGVLPWVRAGATFHDLEVESGAFRATSDRKVGFQASAGVDIPLGQVLSFSPALRYQAYTAEFDVISDNIVAERDVAFLALDFGVHIHPGG
ncbi:MAG: outer membrane beta-barrel protein [Longimicrobiales bacterium]